MMKKKGFDISIIRPEMHLSDFKFRGTGMPSERLKKIRKGLRTLHTLETMAVNIYKFQITKRTDDLNLQIIAAMNNEMTHLQDFQCKLFEYGSKPSKFRLAFWSVGLMFGLFSRWMGRKATLRTGIWVEAKAVRHYDELLRDIEWDDETRMVIQKNQADEFGHIERWQSFLKK